MSENRIKFGLSNVHYAKIIAWSADGQTPTFADPVRITGAVSLSLDANGETENFYADNGVYYVIGNNSGYEGDLEIALVTTDFMTDILGETLDSNGVLVERSNAEFAQFALAFEFEGDRNKIRHWLYCCTASRPATESSTTEDSTEIKTETLSLKATALPTGEVKVKTCESTDKTIYFEWFESVYGLGYKTTDENDYIYTISESKTHIIYYIGKNENPKIPRTLSEASVKTLSAVSFCSSNVTSVYISEGVEEIQ